MKTDKNDTQNKGSQNMDSQNIDSQNKDSQNIDSQNKDSHIVSWFREASPYIDAHRNKTVVIYLSGEAIEESNFGNVISDLNLLSTLGIRLVLVHGATPQIDKHLEVASDYAEDIRITPSSDMAKIVEIVGRMNIEIQSRLSSNITASLTKGSGQLITSGNFVKAKPLGVREGTDFLQTGEVRNINVEALNYQLETGAMVLLSPLGFSPSGEIFNLESHQLAFHTAVSLGADKLVFYVPSSGVLDEEGNTVNELLPQMIDSLNFSALSVNSGIEALVTLAGSACQKGVTRCHLVSYKENGALLKELFTRDGTGTQISRHSYEQCRIAAADDLAGIIALIEPLEVKGILLKRSRELLESELDKFTVIERDGLVIACAALYPFDNKGELACLAIHQDYRNDEKGELLLKSIENQAKSQGLVQIFVLTTQSTHWFKERGFTETTSDDLPAGKMKLYSPDRNSKVLIKSI